MLTVPIILVFILVPSPLVLTKPRLDRDYTPLDSDFIPQDIDYTPLDRDYTSLDTDYITQDRDYVPQDRDYTPLDRAFRPLSRPPVSECVEEEKEDIAHLRNEARKKLDLIKKKVGVADKKDDREDVRVKRDGYGHEKVVVRCKNSYTGIITSFTL